jgi:single-strand DNA-binding protein
MNSIINHVQLAGHVGATPEIKTLDSGKRIAKFPMAINEYYKNPQGEYVKSTQWHTITIFGALVQRIEKLVQKGSALTISGKLHTNAFTDKNGQKQFRTEIIARDVMIHHKPENKQAA